MPIGNRTRVIGYTGFVFRCGNRMLLEPGQRPSRRLPKTLTPYLFALYMAPIMSFLMCLVITVAEFGITDQYFTNVLHAYRVAMPAAFICILVVRPVVAKLVAFSVDAKG
jgi:hypothetical protein